MKIRLSLSLAAALFALQGSASAGNFSGCGILVQDGGGCILLEVANGDRYIPDDGGGGFPLGSMVTITGDYDPTCASICWANVGCIWSAVTTLGCSNPIGTNYCLLVNNSTGAPAIISGSGSDSVSANDLVLSATSVPDQFGVFYYGPAQTQVPFGNGFRCVDGVLNRLDIVMATANELTFALDNTSPPSAGGQITAGSTWNFQAWFRDPVAGGASFNLSDGLEVTFTP
ncbi:MAG: hypothetical protein E2O39_11825 [Planctomycetota bacterium]|nr:MAG: hypothetical protein E2O39_11825 [Planctomycetota bacterium]